MTEQKKKNMQLPYSIVVDSVFKSFDSGKVPVLLGVSLRVKPGECVALWGRSGSGKTTLLHLLGGLDIPDKGSLRVGDINPSDAGSRLELLRNKVGFIFQLHNLIADLTPEENILIPAIGAKKDMKQARLRMHKLAAELGIEPLLKRRIQDLSGGERQRTSICRALLLSPSVILADEPTGALDEKTGEDVFNMMMKLCREEGSTVIMATHERRFADECDRIFRVTNGITEEI
jgi:ABC-type lipoprotein export system ATPase subunit